MASIYSSSGYIFLDQKEYEKALSNYSYALDIHAQLSKNNYEGGDNADYNRLLVEDYINVGLTLDHLGKHQQAIEYYEKALDIDHNNVTALDNKGYALYNLKKYDEAIDIASQAIGIDSNYANVWYNRSVYYASTKIK